ncbi:MAG: prolyl-tRNA synthetase associated domain-containing protein [Lachnospiraceae bacterium]|nr:prolyl-tRNA synthetase associated domain-containing protein [Lachnospiraceae bacterium]
MELHEGRPDSMEGRTAPEIRTYDFLDEHGIHYWQTDHDKAANTMEDCEDVDAILEATICKNLFLCNRQKTKFYMLMMPGDKVFKTKEISHQINSPRLSFAPEEKMTEFLDIHPGAVSVMGLMNDHDNNVQLLIDEDVLAGEYLGCHPCVNTSSLKIKMSDIIDVFLPAVHHAFIKVHLTGED